MASRARGCGCFELGKTASYGKRGAGGETPAADCRPDPGPVDEGHRQEVEDHQPGRDAR
ncbi:hypothetical protein [Streptomyces sp. NBC_01197]|uniref:hypothetical protein n=1 Tax=Streptomyces sp. NBC_01197 TaxID=2903768 RepID=UPI002E15B01F|nr:hypothetical protein OG452_34935 [Streptomyces sp. NBC_01197]